MKRFRILLLLCFVLILASCSSKEKSAEEIRTVLSEQQAAWNKGDLEGFMQGYWKSDSLRFVGKNGITYGWDNILANYKKGFPDAASKGQLNFDILLLEVFSRDAAHVIGKWSLKRELGDVSGHFTLIFRKIEGKWVIVADHTS